MITLYHSTNKETKKISKVERREKKACDFYRRLVYKSHFESRARAAEKFSGNYISAERIFCLFLLCDGEKRASIVFQAADRIAIRRGLMAIGKRRRKSFSCGEGNVVVNFPRINKKEKKFREE